MFFNDQNVLFRPVLYCPSGNGGYAMPPQSARNVTVTTSMQFRHGCPPTVSANRQNWESGLMKKFVTGNSQEQNYSQPATISRNIVLEQVASPYATCAPQLQRGPYSSQIHSSTYYPYCVPMTIPQPQYSTLNTEVGVNFKKTIAMKTSVPKQIPMANSTIVAVGNTTKARAIGVHPLSSQQRLPTIIPHATKKKRSHTLKIIHPLTKKNILDDLDTVQNELHILEASSTNSVTRLDIKNSTSAVKLPEITNSNTDIVQPIETYQTEQKVSNTKQVTDVATTTSEDFNCVQESLPTIYTNQQLPKPEQEEKSAKSQLSTIKEEIIFKQKENTDSSSSTENNSCATSQQPATTICNTKKESAKIMQLGVNKQKQLYKTEQQTVGQRTLTDSTDKIVLNNNAAADKNNNVKKSNFSTNKKTMKHKNEQINKKNKISNNGGKTKVTLSEKGIKEQLPHTSREIKKGAVASIFSKDELINKEDDKNVKTTSTISDDDKKIVIETGNDADFGVTVNIEKDQLEQPSESTTNLSDDIETLNTIKKQYNRHQLMQLRQVNASCMQPDVTNTIMHLEINFNNSNFAHYGNSSRSGNSQNNVQQNYMSGHPGAAAKPIIYFNLSLNDDVKLKEADNAWRPKVLIKTTDIQPDPEQMVNDEKEELTRRVRGILNKLTPEKFEALVQQVIRLKIDTIDKMEAVMILIFEKAIDEPNFSACYANLCQRLRNEVRTSNERMESGTKINLASFGNALLDKTQEEFTENVIKSKTKEEKLKTIREKIVNCKDDNEKCELEALLEEEALKIRRRSAGTVRFIGELFKVNMLTGNIIKGCIEALLKEPNNEDMLECLCKLLTTVGQKFELTKVGKTEHKYSLDDIIQRMESIALKKENTKVSARVRFMLQDVIDLRKRNWQSIRNEAPKTMEQIEKEVNNEQLKISSYRCVNSTTNSGGSVSVQRNDVDRDRDKDRGGWNNERNYRGHHYNQRDETDSNVFKSQQQSETNYGNHSRTQMSNNSNSDDAWYVQTGRGNRSVLVDTSKLVGMAVDMNNKKMGDVDIFRWNKTSSSHPTSTPSNSFAALSLDSHRHSVQDVDRDHIGHRNKGSYKNSIKHDHRYDQDRYKQSGFSQITKQIPARANPGRGGVRDMNSTHSKYQQPFILPKMSLTKTSDNGFGNTMPRQPQQQQQQLLDSASCELTPPTSVTPVLFKELNVSDLKLAKNIITDVIENAATTKCVDESTISCINELKGNKLCGLIYYLLTDYLHLRNIGSQSRRHLGNVFSYLIEHKYISIEHFCLAYNKFFIQASDLMFDIPELWLYTFEFTGPLIVKNLISINDLWHSQVSENDLPSFRLKFLKTFLGYCLREVGPSFTRNMWKKHHIKWTSFMNENEVTKFIQTNKFDYLENENIQPEIESNESKEQRYKRVVEHVEQLLKEGSNKDNIIDYINGNINAIGKSFVNILTTVLANFAINITQMDHTSTYSLNLICFQNICIPILLHCLDCKKDLELECLSAIQLLDDNLEKPKDLFKMMFNELNDAGAISEETIKTWLDCAEKEI